MSCHTASCGSPAPPSAAAAAARHPRLAATSCCCGCCSCWPFSSSRPSPRAEHAVPAYPRSIRSCSRTSCCSTSPARCSLQAMSDGAVSQRSYCVSQGVVGARQRQHRLAVAVLPLARWLKAPLASRCVLSCTHSAQVKHTTSLLSSPEGMVGAARRQPAAAGAAGVW